MGGGGSHTTSYEDERKGVSRRGYGKLASDGIQTQEQFDFYNSLGRGKTIADFTTSEDGDSTDTVDQKGFDAYQAGLQGASYNNEWNRWTVNGVDLEAMKSDWGNYIRERTDTAQYDAKESRRTKAPDDLTGTNGQVDYTLAIQDDKKQDGSVGGDNTLAVDDSSPTTASTNQSLGIY